MRRLLTTYTHLFLLSLGLGSCIADASHLEDLERTASRAHLQLQINTYLPQEGLRLETEVAEVRLMLFEAQTGECVLNEKLRIGGKENLSAWQNKESLKFDALPVKPGKYEAVLLANENSAIADLSHYRKALQGVRNKSDLRALELRHIPYTIADELTYQKPKGPLLMSAYQPEVHIAGGTQQQPQLLTASLVSALSMVEVVLKNKPYKGSWKPTPKRIHQLAIKNLPKYYSNPLQMGVELAKEELFGLSQKVQLSEADYQKEQIATYRFFVPELIREELVSEQQTHPLVVEVSGLGFDTPTKELLIQTSTADFINDLRSQTRLFSEFESAPRLEKEKTNNLLRNTTYRLTLQLGTPDKELEASLEVLPWTLTESERDFGLAKFKVSRQGGKADPNLAHQILTSGQSPVQFILELDQPQGALWRVALTNGIDFKLRAVARNDRDLMGATEGIVKKGMRYIFEVVPTKPFDQRPNGIPRYTEIYLVVDGKEEQLVERFKAENKPSGPGSRYRIKQIE